MKPAILAAICLLGISTFAGARQFGELVYNANGLNPVRYGEVTGIAHVNIYRDGSYQVIETLPCLLNVKIPVYDLRNTSDQNPETAFANSVCNLQSKNIGVLAINLAFNAVFKKMQQSQDDQKLYDLISFNTSTWTESITSSWNEFDCFDFDLNNSRKISVFELGLGHLLTPTGSFFVGVSIDGIEYSGVNP